ncbi:hypothetical protein HOLleu_00730 [Holothuria leucospilota]|uniref:Uncharacterized protein n=1 Tax=Holothuria leucospilota TaxID=206669 RepID=A0A9Q1HIV2_HOLLE|nr:hypothetical protein HOLleu_00730 [Holothuria leucospilota]
MHSFSIISDDLTHDHHAVHEFTSAAIKHVRKEMTSPLTKVVLFTDGCSSQYKSKGPFADISYAMEDHGVPIQHEYFGSRHDPDSADTTHNTDGNVSSQLGTPKLDYTVGEYVAVIYDDDWWAGEVIGAKDNKCHINFMAKKGDNKFMDAAHNINQKGHLLISRMLWKTMVSLFNMSISDPDTGQDSERSKQGKLPGTRRTHSVKTVRAGVVAWRNLTCFCSACVNGVGDCINSAYVHKWKEFKVGSDINEQEQSNEDPDSADTTHNTDGNVSSQLGTPKLDYTGMLKDIAWVEKTGIFTRLPSAPEPVNSRHMGFDVGVFNFITAAVKNYLKEK